MNHNKTDRIERYKYGTERNADNAQRPFGHLLFGFPLSRLHALFGFYQGVLRLFASRLSDNRENERDDPEPHADPSADRRHIRKTKPCHLRYERK